MRTKIFGGINALAVAVLLALATAPGIGAAQAQQANAVIIKNFDFAPMTLTVKAGTSVTWKNLDGEPHTITSVDGLFRSGAIDQDESFTYKFDKPGTYKYLCSIHPKMRAAIIVQ
jgi:plastocyanin